MDGVTKLKTVWRDQLAILALAALFFLPFLGGCHLFDWDEINFAECAREMIVVGDWSRPQIGFQPFWEKPPLFIWLQAISMSVFGINEFAARLPNAICGAATLLIIYTIGKKHGSRRFAWLWVWAWLASLLPHLYFRSGIIDPWFNLLIFSGLYLFFEKKAIAGGALIGLAVLTKGPVALLIFGLVVGVELVLPRALSSRSDPSMPDISPATPTGRSTMTKKKDERPNIIWRIWSIFLAIFTCLAVASTWFLVEYLKNGTWFIERFITYQIRLFSTPDAGHGGFFGYHFVVLLVGCFPASVFAVRQFFQKSNDFSWMKTLFWVVLILFSITTTKIIHYSSLCYFPLTFLAARTLEPFFLGKTRIRFLEKMGLWLIGTLLGTAAILLPLLGKNIDSVKNLIKNDPFALASLDAKVGWTGWESLIGAVLLTGLATGFYFLKKEKNELATAVWLGSGAFFVSFGLVFFIRKIEGHSQRAAIEFYESKRGENCEIRTHKFFSYAHHFYQKQMPRDTNLTADKFYFVAKIPRLDGLADNPAFSEIYRKNGFVFYERKPAE